MEKKFGVAVKAVIVNDKKEFLILVKSSTEDINPNTYDFPGGRIEFGEQLSKAVVREVEEETRLSVDVMNVFEAWTFVKDDSFQLVGIDYLCKYTSGDIVLSAEHDTAEWMSYENIIVHENLPGWMKDKIKKAYALIFN